jgi:hypothetical protein
VGTTSGDTAREWPPEDMLGARVTEHAAICSSGFPVWMEGVGAVAGDDASAAADAAREGAAIAHARMKYVYCDCCTRPSCCTACPAGCGLFPDASFVPLLGSSPLPALVSPCLQRRGGGGGGAGAPRTPAGHANTADTCCGQGEPA